MRSTDYGCMTYRRRGNYVYMLRTKRCYLATLQVFQSCKSCNCISHAEGQTREGY